MKSEHQFCLCASILLLSCVAVTPLPAVELEPLLKPKPDDTPRIKKAKQILRSNPRRDLALYGLAHGSYQIGRYRDAIKVYNYMIEIGVDWNPRFIHSDKAHVQTRLGQHEKAAKNYRKSLEMDSEFSHPYAGLAIMWIRQKRNYEKAEEYLKKAIKYEQVAEILKDTYRVYLGAAYLGQDRVDKAIETLKKAKEAIPVTLVGQNFPTNDVESVYEVRYFLARAYMEKGDTDAAMAELQSAIDARETRMNSPNRGRQTAMPRGTWEMIEHPGVFRYLFTRWKLP